MTQSSSAVRRRSWLLACIATALALVIAYTSLPGTPGESRQPEALLTGKDPDHDRKPRALTAVASQALMSSAAIQRGASALRWVRGSIRSWDGTTLANAEVCLVAQESQPDAPFRCAYTDGAGSYRLLASAGSELVIATAPGHSSQARAVPDAGDLAPFDFVLRHEMSATLSGVVVDASGGTVSGAAVFVRRAAVPDPVASTFSEADGRFEMFVAPGQAIVTAQAESYAPATARIDVPAESLTLVLAAGSTLAGEVVDAVTDRPVAAVVVSATARSALHPATFQDRTDAAGRFEISGLHAAEYELIASGERWAGESVSITLAVADVSEGTRLRVRAASQVSAVVRTAGTACAGAQLALHGVAPSGRALPHAYPTDFGALADADGKLTLSGVIPGNYIATVDCAGAISWAGELEVGAQPMHREWELERGATVRGRVERANGDALAGAHVGIESRRSEEALPTPAVQCRSDDAGSFECGGLAPGEYEISLGPEPLATPTSILLRSGAMDPPPILLRAKASATIVAHIGTAQSARIGSFEVLARKGDDLPVSAVVETDGRAHLALSLGEYTVYLGPTSSVPREAQRVLLSADGQRVEVELSQPRLLDISGVVLDAAGSPLPDQWVHAESTAREATGFPLGAPALSNERGEFTLLELLDGTYNIFAGERRSPRTAGVQAGAHDVVLRFAN